MKAAIYNGKRDIVLNEVAKPTVTEPTDVIVKVTWACVCGSDLWFYRGIGDHQEGPVGHEFIGIVDEIGENVQNLERGDFVISPFSFSDNQCPNCQNGIQTACLHGGFFGMGAEGDGGQAEYVRVPQADGTLVKVPEGEYSEETIKSFLALSDVMSTGYHAAVSAGVKQGDTVAVVGDGAVGLSAVLSSKLLGAERIIIMSGYEDRQQLATEWGATDIVETRGETAIEDVRALTDGIGADAVMECVGTQEAIDTAFGVARAGAIVGRVGVPHYSEINPQSTFFANVGMRGGPAPAREYIPELLKAVLDGKINPGKVFDFVTDLENIAEAYEAMDERRAIKSLVKVSEQP